MELSTGTGMMDRLAGFCIDELIDCWLFFSFFGKKKKVLTAVFTVVGVGEAAAEGDGKQGVGQGGAHQAITSARPSTLTLDPTSFHPLS